MGVSKVWSRPSPARYGELTPGCRRVGSKEWGCAWRLLKAGAATETVLGGKMREEGRCAPWHHHLLPCCAPARGDSPVLVASCPLGRCAARLTCPEKGRASIEDEGWVGALEGKGSLVSWSREGAATLGFTEGSVDGTVAGGRGQPQAPSKKHSWASGDLGGGRELLVHSFMHSLSISLGSSVCQAQGHHGGQAGMARTSESPVRLELLGGWPTVQEGCGQDSCLARGAGWLLGPCQLGNAML